MLKTTCLAAAAALLAVPAFAQTAVNSGSGATVTSGTGVVVSPSVSATAVVPAGTVVAAPKASITDASVVAAGTTESVNGNTRTVVTRYWVNVPAGVEREAEFQRWQRLR